MAKFLESSVTPEGLQQMDSLQALMQAEADRAVRTRMHEDQMAEAKLTREQAMAEAAVTRAQQAKENAAGRASAEGMQSKQIAAEQAAQQERLAAQQAEQQQAMKFTDAQRRASEAHSRWVLQREEKFEVLKARLDAQIAAAGGKAAARLEKVRARLEAQHLATQAKTIAAQKLLDGSQAQIQTGLAGMAKLREGFVAEDKAASDLGLNAARTGLDLLRQSRQSALSDEAVTTTAARQIMGVFTGSKTAAKAYQEHFGTQMTVPEVAKALGRGFSTALGQSGADVTKAAKGEAAMVELVQKMMETGAKMASSTSFGGQESDRLLLRETKDLIASSGVNPATLRAFLATAVSGIRETAANMEKSGMGAVDADNYNKAAARLSAAMGLIPQSQATNIKVLEAATEIMRTGNVRAAEQMIMDALDGAAEQQALENLREVATGRAGTAAGKKAMGDLEQREAGELGGAGIEIADEAERAAIQTAAEINELLNSLPQEDIPPEPMPWQPGM